MLSQVSRLTLYSSISNESLSDKHTFNVCCISGVTFVSLYKRGDRGNMRNFQKHIMECQIITIHSLVESVGPKEAPRSSMMSVTTCKKVKY